MSKVRYIDANLINQIIVNNREAPKLIDNDQNENVRKRKFIGER